jgi:hypothetical protein
MLLLLLLQTAASTSSSSNSSLCCCDSRHAEATLLVVVDLPYSCLEERAVQAVVLLLLPLPPLLLLLIRSELWRGICWCPLANLLLLQLPDGFTLRCLFCTHCCCHILSFLVLTDYSSSSSSSSTWGMRLAVTSRPRQKRLNPGYGIHHTGSSMAINTAAAHSRRTAAASSAGARCSQVWRHCCQPCCCWQRPRGGLVKQLWQLRH